MVLYCFLILFSHERFAALYVCVHGVLFSLSLINEDSFLLHVDHWEWCCCKYDHTEMTIFEFFASSFFGYRPSSGVSVLDMNFSGFNFLGNHCAIFYRFSIILHSRHQMSLLIHLK